MMFWTAGLFLAGVTLPQSLPAATADSPAEKMAYLDNGIIRIGASLERGGSIGFLCDDKKGSNIVNIHDLGRWIGQSYYSGPRPFGAPRAGWNNWPWNPVSAGDVCGNPSKLVEVRNDGKTLYIKSIPMQWALNNVPGDCRFETWITLDARTATCRNRLTNDRADQTEYPAMDQELPAVYTIGKLHRLISYTGDAPFSEQPPTEIPEPASEVGQPQWTTFFATEHWAALVDDDGWGLGVIHPGVVRFLGGFYGTAQNGGPNDDSTGYIAPVRQEILDHNIVYEYDYTLVLDTIENIRNEARKLSTSGAPDYHFASDRQHWWFQNAQDTGYPIKGYLRLKVAGNAPRMFGPEGFWDASDAPTIYIRAAYHTKGKLAQVYWESATKPGFTADQKVSFAIEPDGMFHTYEVKLAASPLYRGKIRRLRFDPLESGGAGEFVDIEFISAKADASR